MQPITPDITTREIAMSDAPALATLLNKATSDLMYCRAYDAESVRADILNESNILPEVYAEWHSRLCIGAWQAGTLIGFVDTAVVRIAEGTIAVGSVNTGMLPQQSSPYDRYCGLIRSLILPKNPDLATDVQRLLLEPIEERWQTGGLERIDAFIPSLGYRRIQAGSGILPGEWREHFRLLTASGFQLEHRYRVMCLELEEFVEEVYPLISISLETHETEQGWTSRLYHRRVSPIGTITMIGGNLSPHSTQNEKPRHANDELIPVATIHSLQVDDEWKESNLERLLLRRAINDCRHQNYQQMLMYLRHDRHEEWSLLAQHRFQELDYRGYTFQKHLIHAVA